MGFWRPPASYSKTYPKTSLRDDYFRFADYSETIVHNHASSLIRRSTSQNVVSGLARPKHRRNSLCRAEEKRRIH